VLDRHRRLLHRQALHHGQQVGLLLGVPVPDPGVGHRPGQQLRLGHRQGAVGHGLTGGRGVPQPAGRVHHMAGVGRRHTGQRGQRPSRPMRRPERPDRLAVPLVHRREHGGVDAVPLPGQLDDPRLQPSPIEPFH